MCPSVKQCRPRRKQRGITLIEVLASTFAALVCASVVFASMPVANTSRAKANNENKAMNLAQKQLETIRSVGYANITPDKLLQANLIDSTTPVAPNAYSFTNTDNAALDNPGLVLTNGKGSVEIDDIAPNVRQVIITINWRERSKTRKAQLGTLVANL